MTGSVARERGLVPLGARTPSDAALLQRLARGEIGALGELYDRYHDGVRRFLARATGGADDVDDLVHSTFLNAAKSAPRYDGRECCKPWLIGIAVQMLRHRRQSLRRFLRAMASFGRGRPKAFDPRPALGARRDVERALLRVSEPKRITLLLAEVGGLTCPEIAEELGIPVGTVWTRLHAARCELRRALAEDGP